MFSDGFSPISQVLRQGREFGIGVVLGLASLGPVSRHVLNEYIRSLKTMLSALV